MKTDDVLKAVLRHHWNSELYKPASLEKVMTLSYFHGVMDYTRREVKRFFGAKRKEVRPLAVESEFSIDGEVEGRNDADEPKLYRLRGVFDRIEG